MKYILFTSVFLLLSVLNAATLDVRISASTDDAIEELNTGNIYDGENQLDLVVYNGSYVATQKVGLRFSNVQIPSGVTINNAYLEFRATRDEVGQTDLAIVGENSSNPTTYTTANADITSRSETSASVDWLNVPVWAQGLDYQTVDITSIVQELVNLGGWQSGNAMAFMIKPFDANCSTAECLRQAVSFDGSSATAPLLHIVFGNPPTPPTMGVVPNSTANVDISYTFNIADYVTPTDGDPILSYDLNDTLPDGLQIDNTTGIISGMPRFAGVKTLSVTATDKDGTSTPASFTITTVDSLIAEYRMDECFWLGSAYQDVKDHSFNAFNGTSYNNTSVDLTNAQINYSGIFDGVADTIDVTHNVAFDIQNKMSVSLWVYPTRANKDEYYVSKDDASAGWYLFFNNRSTDRIEFKVRIGNRFRRVSINKPNSGWLNQWHFIAGTYDGTQLNLYVDNLTASSPRNGNITNSSNPLLMGKRYDNKRFFAGNIDEVKVWNSALSSSEIASIYNNELAGKNYNGTTRSPVTCNATIQANTWEMIGVPAEARSGTLGVQDVFGDDFVGANYDAGSVNGWVMWTREYHAADNLSTWVKVDYVANEPIVFGKGYWLGSTLDVTWDTDNLVSTDYNSTYNGTSDCMAKRCVEIDLRSVSSDGTDGSGVHRYNLSGFIGKVPIEWRNVRFIISDLDGSNVEVLTPEEADTAGYASRTISIWPGGLGNGSGGNILSTDYTECSDTTPGGCKLTPYHGLWVKVFVTTLTKTVKLLIPEE